MEEAALVQDPQMEIDRVSSEFNTNGFVVLNPGFDYRIQQEVVPHNIMQLTTHLQAAVDEAWPNRLRSRYKRVKVLLASWDADDLGVVEEVRALEHVLIDFYKFDVSRYIIPSHHPDRALTRRVIEFVDSALKDTLLIFYYAGHASTNPNRYDSIIWSANRQRISPALTSNGIQALFEAADCDTLLLYDCCHSANTAIIPAKSSRGATELIAACGFEGIAAEVGEHSFTNALIEVLVLSSSGSSFSASQLHIRIVQQLMKWSPLPTRDGSGKFVQNSFGQPVMEPQRRQTPVYCNLTPDGGQNTIMLPCIPQGPIAESFAPPLGGGSTSGSTTFGQIVSMAALSPSVIMGTNAVSSNEAVTRNPHMIITVRMVDDVVAGQQDPNFDAWLEWLRSAPPDVDRIRINFAENTHRHLKDSCSESLPCSHQGEEPQAELSGHRMSSMNAERARKAKKIRKISACPRCRWSKAQCLRRICDVCARCSTLSSPLNFMVCIRFRLEDHSQLFFPEFLISHLEESRVRRLEHEVCSSFTDNNLEVDITTGLGHLSLRLQATEFTPSPYELRRFLVMSSETTGEQPMFMHKWPLPIALCQVTMDDLLERCRLYITTVVRQPSYLLALSSPRINKVSKQVLDAAIRYHKSICHSPQGVLLEKALMIYAIHCFMRRAITLTRQSVERVIHQLRKPSLIACPTNLISKVLNSQVKSAMLGLLRELTWDVLENLQKNLSTRKVSVWATSFCVISILCISIEDIQCSINVSVIFTKFLGTSVSSSSYGDCIQACRKLDDHLFAHLNGLFHEAFGTKKWSSAAQSYAFDPMRNSATHFNDLDQSSLNLINDIRQVISDEASCLPKLAETPSFDSSSNILTQHILFCERNLGRLLSKFLKSFPRAW